MRYLTHDEILLELQALLEKHKTISALARVLDVPRDSVRDGLRRNRNVPFALAHALGYRKIQMFVPIEDSSQ